MALGGRQGVQMKRLSLRAVRAGFNPEWHASLDARDFKDWVEKRAFKVFGAAVFTTSDRVEQLSPSEIQVTYKIRAKSGGYGMKRFIKNRSEGSSIPTDLIVMKKQKDKEFPAIKVFDKLKATPDQIMAKVLALRKGLPPHIEVSVVLPRTVSKEDIVKWELKWVDAKAVLCTSDQVTLTFKMTDILPYGKKWKKPFPALVEYKEGLDRLFGNLLSFTKNSTDKGLAKKIKTLRKRVKQASLHRTGSMYDGLIDLSYMTDIFGDNLLAKVKKSVKEISDCFTENLEESSVCLVFYFKSKKKGSGYAMKTDPNKTIAKIRDILKASEYKVSLHWNKPYGMAPIKSLGKGMWGSDVCSVQVYMSHDVLEDAISAELKKRRKEEKRLTKEEKKAPAVTPKQKKVEKEKKKVQEKGVSPEALRKQLRSAQKSLAEIKEHLEYRKMFDSFVQEWGALSAIVDAQRSKIPITASVKGKTQMKRLSIVDGKVSKVLAEISIGVGAATRYNWQGEQLTLQQIVKLAKGKERFRSSRGKWKCEIVMDDHGHVFGVTPSLFAKLRLKDLTKPATQQEYLQEQINILAGKLSMSDAVDFNMWAKSNPGVGPEDKLDWLRRH